MEPVNFERSSTCLSCRIKVEAARLYEVTLRMIVKDHEVRAFKHLRFVQPAEVYDPYDLLERQ